ncbi:MAG: hypothetical protein OEL89_02200, partial [Candidatus Peregrinibacteria bacterium]|nr:hypothetical protein [Candidatus Peregrinibacteria bacterium]
MKKLILALAVLSLFTVEIIEAAWYTQARYYNYRPSTSSSRNYRNYVPRTTSTFRSRNYRNYRHRTTSTFKRTNRRVSPRTYLYSRTKRTTSTEQLTVKVAPVRSLNAITSVYDDPAKIFEINVSNPGLRSSQLYTEAIKLTDLEFKMFGNTGVAANPRNFQLVVNDESFNFDRNGKVNLSFKNARLARGENIDLDIYLKFKEPDTTPNISGSMQIRVTGATAQKEQSRLAAKTSISGNSSSRIIRIDPTATVSTGYSSGVVSGFTSAISGRTLMTGEKAVVLGLNLNAYYDDLKIEKITVADSLSGGNIDS